MTRCTDEKSAAREVQEDQFRELITKLERLQAHLDQSPGKVMDIPLLEPPVPNPYNPLSLPAPPCAGGMVERDRYSDGSCSCGSGATVGHKTEKEKTGQELF